MDWQLTKSDLIINNQAQFIKESTFIHQKFRECFPGGDSTWNYNYYNVFAAASPSVIWYNLYKELRETIRRYVNHDEPLWVQSWLNFHKSYEPLDWHNHDWAYHGYISIDPKSTRTVFDGYEIKNEVGNIYIGPGSREHKVEVDDNYHDSRITLGFDIHDAPAKPYDKLWSLLPLI